RPNQLGNQKSPEVRFGFLTENPREPSKQEVSGFQSEIL
ncbi:MAG: hypothetical protein ACI8T1_004813, partial [Verrucomicrobiales bacterium]